MVTDPDPFYDWLERNSEVAALHAGKRCAFHPEHGLLAVGKNLEELFDVLGEKSKLEGLMLGVFPSDVPWVPCVVTDPSADEWRKWARYLLKSYSWIDTDKVSDAELREELERLVRRTT